VSIVLSNAMRWPLGITALWMAPPRSSFLRADGWRTPTSSAGSKQVGGPSSFNFSRGPTISSRLHYTIKCSGSQAEERPFIARTQGKDAETWGICRSAQTPSFRPTARLRWHSRHRTCRAVMTISGGSVTSSHCRIGRRPMPTPVWRRHCRCSASFRPPGR
jgi:hypothetical protein